MNAVHVAHLFVSLKDLLHRKGLMKGSIEQLFIGAGQNGMTKLFWPLLCKACAIAAFQLLMLVRSIALLVESLLHEVR